MTMLPPPARFQGTAQQQLAQCYSYLFQLHQQLNNALAALPAALPAGSGRAFSQAGSAGEEIDQGIHREAEALRALIVQNASYIRREMDKLRTELAGSYVAVSDFGQYLQELNAAIEADPAAVTQYYSFLSVLQADLSAVEASFQTYRVETEGYIRTGIVGYEGQVPLYGVAVGQGLTVTQVDGQSIITSTQFRSTFTARKLSFWQGEVEVAYLSDNRLYISGITVLGAMDLGQKWAISHENGLQIKWIGG